MPKYNETYDAQLAVLVHAETKRELEALASVKYLNVSIIVRKVLIATLPQMIDQLSEAEKEVFDSVMETDEITAELEALVRRDDERESGTTGSNGEEPDRDDPSVVAESPSQF